MACQFFAQQRLDKLQQMPHLFEFAARVLVELALTRQDVQGLLELRIEGGKLWWQIAAGGWFSFGHEE